MLERKKLSMKILQINDNLSDSSGVCRIMMNYYDILKSKASYSFYILEKNDTNYYNKLKNDKTLVCFNDLKIKPTNYLKIRNNFEKFLNKNKFDIVELHCPHYGFLFLDICKKNKIDVRIMHAHSSIFSTSKLKSIIGKTINFNSKNTANEYFTCSDLATKYWFGHRKNVYFIPNIVDTTNYTSLTKKEIASIKESLNIKNEKVIGFVGRLSKEKNIDFILNLIKSTKEKDYIYLIIGTGPEEGKLKRELIKNNLQNKVVMAGYCKNVYDFYQVMDLLILPSKKEGLPVSVIEAQYYCVPCIVSSSITNQVNLGFVNYVKLDVKEWIEKIDEVLKNNNFTKNDKYMNFFDKKKAGDNLYKIYDETIKNNKN